MSPSLTRTPANRWKAWRKYENRRTTPGVPRQKRWYVLACLLLLGAGVYAPTGWATLSHYIRQHPYFAVSAIDVDVDAGALFSQKEIITWSGVTYGTNLWTVDPEQVRVRLLTHQGIRDVEVRREFPQRVIVQVRTRHPLAVIANSSLTYLDQDGVWFRTQGQKAELDLPYVTGVNEDELDTAPARTALTGAVSLLSLARKFWPEPVSEVRWDQEAGYTVFLARRHLAIRFGWEAAPEKFVQVTTVLAQWPEGAPPALFDARFMNQIVVRPFLDEYGLRPVTPADPL